MTSVTISTTNGMNTAALEGLADTLRANPDVGRLGFVTRSRWQDGGRVFTRTAGYRIDGEMQHEEERAFVQLCDEPIEFGATDTAPAPAEQLMHAMASCILATTTAYAALGGVRLSQLELELESDVDLHGIFGLDSAVRPGLQELRATITVAGEANRETLHEIAMQGLRFSPIRDSVQKGVEVRARIEAK
jgi:uncharacterized OsmC-like protein